jgi:hypothetical protein
MNKEIFMGDVITSYKGFDKDLKCHGGFQYEIGKEYEQESALVCDHGFHACEMPLHVFNHFAPGNGSRYCVVEQSGEISKREESDDSKLASSKIKIGAEIGIPGLVKAQIEYVRSRCTNEHNAEPGKAATAGSYGAATAGSYGAATAGDSGAATAGYRGAATSRGIVSVGKNGSGLVRGNDVRIKGGIGSVLVIVIENCNDYDIKEWTSFIVDGDKYKPDTWYTLRNGDIVEAE